MRFIITTKTTLDFRDAYIKELQEIKGKTIDDMTNFLKREFEELIAYNIGTPNDDFLGYSLSVEAEAKEDKEESDVQS